METALFVVWGVFAGIGMLTIALAAYVIGEAFYYQVLLGPALERDLGFREGAVYMPAEGMRGYVSAVAIVAVEDGGVFERAGVRAGDVLPDYSHSSLFRSLHRARGRTADIAVVDGGPGPLFHHRNRRVIRLAVPPRRPRSRPG